MQTIDIKESEFNPKFIMNRSSILYVLGFMMFFVSIFDGLISFSVPILITENGFSTTVMGMIYGFSSVAGGFFDFVLSKVLETTHFRRLFMMFFAVCLATALILWHASTVFMFLLAMALWGLFYDLRNFGTYDFVSRSQIHSSFATTYGLIDLFFTIGYLVAPIIGGLMIANLTKTSSLFVVLPFLLVSFFFFLVLTNIYDKWKKHHGSKELVATHSFSIREELRIWMRISKRLWPVLIFKVLLNFYNAFYWTIGPLFSLNPNYFPNFGGVLITLHMSASLFTGWFVGKVTKKYGQKRTAFIAFIISSLILATIGLIANQYFILAMIFISSLFGAFCWPAIDGAYTDYISETENKSKQIQALGDFAGNVGYVFGPIVAGLLADNVGNSLAFTFLGIFGAVVAAAVFMRTPKRISPANL